MAHVDDIEEIRQLIARICHFTDSGQYQRWVECFANDGVLEFNGRRIVGHQAILATREGLLGITPRRHWISNVVIDVDGDEATAASYLLEVSATSKPSVLMSGVYRDRIRRVDGTWRLSERVFVADGDGPTASPAAD